MTDIARLEGLDEGAVARLRAEGLGTIDDLWRRSVEDVADNAAFERRLAEIAGIAGLDAGPDALLDILADNAEDRAKHRRRGGSGHVRRLVAAASRNWLEIAAVTASLLVAVALLGRFSEDREVSVLLPRSSLPAYHLLTASDLRPATRNPPPGRQSQLLAPTADAAGRYTLRPLSSATPIRRSDLSRPFATAPDREVVSLAADLGGLQPVRGMSVSLLVAALEADRDPAVTIGNVLLLDFDREQGSIVVAVTRDDLQRIGPLLGAARILVVQPAY